MPFLRYRTTLRRNAMIEGGRPACQNRRDSREINNDVDMSSMFRKGRTLDKVMWNECGNQVVGTSAQSPAIFLVNRGKKQLRHNVFSSFYAFLFRFNKLNSLHLVRPIHCCKKVEENEKFLSSLVVEVVFAVSHITTKGRRVFCYNFLCRSTVTFRDADEFCRTRTRCCDNEIKKMKCLSAVDDNRNFVRLPRHLISEPFDAYQPGQRSLSCTFFNFNLLASL